jgi:hypothetical protein
VRHSLFNLLTSGGGAGYTQLWHRDFHPDQTKQAEVEADWLRVRCAMQGRVVQVGPASARPAPVVRLARLTLIERWPLMAQMNAPLLPGDDVLQVV